MGAALSHGYEVELNSLQKLDLGSRGAWPAGELAGRAAAKSGRNAQTFRDNPS